MGEQIGKNTDDGRNYCTDFWNDDDNDIFPSTMIMKFSDFWSGKCIAIKFDQY